MSTRCAFKEDSPEALFRKVMHEKVQSGITSYMNIHCIWLDTIRSRTYDRAEFENHCLPSNEALRLHWLRTIYVAVMWNQANRNNVILPDITKFGWTICDGKLKIVWDTDDNMTKVRERVRTLLKGCGCKSGCQTKRCSCFKKEPSELCTAGCTCISCKNVRQMKDSDSLDVNTVLEEEIEEQTKVENELYKNEVLDDYELELQDSQLDDLLNDFFEVCE